ncbi:single-stranded DNA-binding protein [Nocardia alni]|uniref:single-stranded DNA-binding protein n=1 Tax=Nocardia alni TaxID=2815723 RepID=UPI001C2378B2|nr:single-stranded DNA-binding protein [Nocardia alni]
MAGEAPLTLTGNLTADPEIRFTPGGSKVATVVVAQNSRVLNQATGEWKDSGAVFMRCNIWDEMAENVVKSLSKGTRVLVHGRLTQNRVTNDDGETRTYTDLRVDSIGPDLRYAQATVKKIARNVTDPSESAPAEPSSVEDGAKVKAPF